MKYNFNDIDKEVKIKYIFDTLTKGNIGVIGGIGAVGKSYFILEQIIKNILFKNRIILENSLIKLNFKKVLFITTEDEYTQITKRIQNILIVLFKTNDVKNIKEIKQIKEILNNNFNLIISNNGQETQQTIKGIKDETLLILDTLSVILNLKNENDNAELSNKIEQFKSIARNKNIAIIFIHHLSQAGIGIEKEDEITAEKLRGATTLLNNTRYVAILAKIKNKDKKHLIYKVVKNNNAANTKIKMNPDFWDFGFQEIKPERKY